MNRKRFERERRKSLIRRRKRLAAEKPHVPWQRKPMNSSFMVSQQDRDMFLDDYVPPRVWQGFS